MTTEKIVKDIYHVGVNVNDMDKALEFYRDILGFKVKSDDIAEGEIADTGLGLKGVKFRQVYLQAENSELELFQYIKPLGKEIDIEQRNCDRGIRHIAFVVNDIGSTYEKLLQKGIKFISEPLKNPDGVQWVFFQDPEGIMLEFVQLPGK